MMGNDGQGPAVDPALEIDGFEGGWQHPVHMQECRMFVLVFAFKRVIPTVVWYPETHPRATGAKPACTSKVCYFHSGKPPFLGLNTILVQAKAHNEVVMRHFSATLRCLQTLKFCFQPGFALKPGGVSATDTHQFVNFGNEGNYQLWWI